jgi:hypothetical protein
MFKSRKLLILRIARNAKTAKNVFRGYAAATRNAARAFMPVGIVGTQEFILATKTNQWDYGAPLFPKESAWVASGSNQF